MVVVDGAGGRGLEAQQQPDDGGLARPRRPDEGDEFAGVDVEGNVVQDQRPLRLVAEGNVAHLHVAAEVAWGGLAPGDLGGRIEDRPGASYSGTISTA